MFYAATKISLAIRRPLLREQRGVSLPLPSPAARPCSSAVRALAWPSRARGCGSHRGQRHECALTSSRSTASTLHYQLLQAALQITHLAQITPVSAHLTVMLLMLYFTVTPNLSPYCTIFCHLLCKINKDEGRDYCEYRGKLKRTVSVTAFSSPAWRTG